MFKILSGDIAGAAGVNCNLQYRRKSCLAGHLPERCLGVFSVAITGFLRLGNLSKNKDLFHLGFWRQGSPSTWLSLW